MTVSGVPGRTATVTMSGSSLPSVRPSEFIAALDALRRGTGAGRVSDRTRGLRADLTTCRSSRGAGREEDGLVRRPPGHTTCRRPRTDQHDPPRGLSLLQALFALPRTQVRDGMREDGDEGKEVDVEEGLELVEAGAGEGRDGAEGVEGAGVDCGAQGRGSGPAGRGRAGRGTAHG